MAMRISELIKLPALRAEMGQKGRILAAQEFGLRQMIDKIEGLYEELLSRLPH
jgi:glycosyltransferase involved in cell wall biosynthesis